MKVISYVNAMNHWKKGYLAWNPKLYSYYRKNFYIGLAFYEFNPKFATDTGKAYAFYHDTDQELEDRSIYEDMGVYCSPVYNYYIKISSKEIIDNLTEDDYNKMIMDFEHKIKSYKIKNRIDDISKDFE